MKREIKQLTIEGNISFYAKSEKIERFLKAGEMANIEWFRQGDKEINGRYVMIIRYFNE